MIAAMPSTDADREALTRLTRLAQRRERAAAWLADAIFGRLERLAEPGLDVVIATGDPLGTVLARALETQASPTLLERVMEKCSDLKYRVSSPLREVALVSTKAFVDERRARWTEPDEDQLATLAHRIQNLAYWFSLNSRREEALAASSEAVTILRELAPKRPKKYLPALATALDAFASDLSDLGQYEESLAASQEAVKLGRRLEKIRSTRLRRYELWRKLAAERPDAFTRSLAGSLDALSSLRSHEGGHEDALAMAEEVVALLRPLAISRPHVYLEDLAVAFHNLANRLDSVGRSQESLATSEEAIRIRRELYEQHPDAFRRRLALSLRNLGFQLAARHRFAEADEALTEAVELYRQEAAKAPDAMGPEVARSLKIHAQVLADRGRPDAAFEVFAEAVATLRPHLDHERRAAPRFWSSLERDYRRLLKKSVATAGPRDPRRSPVPRALCDEFGMLHTISSTHAIPRSDRLPNS